MATPALQKVIAFAAQHDLFSQDARVLAGVSGGSDSTALFWMLIQLQKQNVIKELVCVHFNHQLRDEAAQDEARGLLAQRIGGGAEDDA